MMQATFASAEAAKISGNTRRERTARIFLKLAVSTRMARAFWRTRREPEIVAKGAGPASGFSEPYIPQARVRVQLCHFGADNQEFPSLRNA